MARLNYLSVRIGTRNVPGALAHIRKVWRTLVPSYPLDYAFLDESFERLHDSERRMSKMFSVFAFLAIGSQTWRAARANPIDSLRYE